MARSVTGWVGATVCILVAVAFAYLPPRGAPALRSGSLFAFTPPQASAARQRVQELAEEWRRAAATVRLLEGRARVLAGTPGPTLLLVGVDSVPAAARSRVVAALDTVWRGLGLGETKVAVGLIIDVSAARPPTPRAPRPNRETPAYLLPDSTDRTACLAMIPTSVYWASVILGQRTPGQPSGVPHLQLWLKGVLGPCAFYAAFGAPGQPVRRWLGARAFDLALYPDWDAGPPVASSGAGFMMNDGRSQWYWGFVYHQSFSAVACLAGRAASCRAAVVGGADEGSPDSLPRFMGSNRVWWRSQRLVGGERYLADVAREVGPERFVRFWNTSMPVDTALAVALRAPVGEWTKAWQRRFAPLLPLGPAAPLGATLLGVVLGAAAVGSVVLTASRRQVR